MSKQALEGLRVIEYGNLISAPYCAKLFAGLGAEVTKVENIDGDEARWQGPFPDDDPHPEKGGLFLSLNTNKLGIALNLRTSTGRKILGKLLEETDVFVENNPPKHLKEVGLDYASLKGINPRLVMVSITPFGQSGPYKDYKARHINSCAAGGVAMGIGYPDREPLTMPLSQGGYQAGVSAAIAVLLALIARNKTTEGQHIDISEVEIWSSLHLGQNVVNYIYRGVAGTRRGIHGGYFTYPCTIIRCKDGYVGLIAPQVAQWARFIELLGSPEWSQDPRYRDRRAMHEEYPDEVNALLLPWFRERTKEEIFRLCRENRIPFAPIYAIDEVANHPHLKERAFFDEIEHPQAGRLKYPEGPCKFSKTNWQLERPAPLLGQHDEQILCERLGYSREDLLDLRREGVISSSSS